MKNNEAVRIAIAETSVIIRGGLTAALKRLPNVKVQPIELLSVEALNDCLRTQYPEMLIVNPAFGDYFDVARFREEIGTKRIRVVALVSSFIDASLLSKYDDLPQAEIAQIMLLSEGAVESLLQRAKKNLQKKLAAYA